MIIKKANSANKLNPLAKKLKLSAYFFAASLIAFPALSAEEKAERWFEIEVILFSQLGDKAQVKESFPNLAQQPSELPNYRRTKDLLTSYIYPDISSLKLQLPECGDFSAQKTLVELATTTPELITTKTLQQIDNTIFINEFSDPLFEKNEVNKSISKTNNEQEAIVLSDEDSTSSLLTDKDQLLISDELEPSFIPSITAAQLALVAQAESEFNDIRFEYSNGLPSKQICLLPTSYNDKFSTSLSGTVDGAENLTSDKPYLISKDSLQLSDIVLKLKRSKNFKPLLHLGWREAPKDRNKATAFRIFSGDNLAFEDEKAQSNYQASLRKIKKNKAKNTLDLTSQLVSETFEGNETVSEQSSPLKEVEQQITPEQIIQNRINDILAGINSISALNEQEIITQLDGKSLALNIQEEAKSELTEPSIIDELGTSPTKPIQPWPIDGLFRVHLNHYLYITADFNILTLASTDKNNSDDQSPTVNTPKYKSIRFNQNRRVISGEIHYFDHPYIGMIVQIRKHKRPEPEEVVELESDLNINNAKTSLTN